MTVFWLRCDKCGRSLDDSADEPMQLVGLFKPSALGVVPKSHRNEVRHRCRGCGYVNLFVPVADVPDKALTYVERSHIVLK